MAVEESNPSPQSPRVPSPRAPEMASKQTHPQLPEILIEPDQEPLFSASSHPLAEISDSPGHLLLLRLLHRAQDVAGDRINLGESHCFALKRQIFHLSCLFFAFHFLFLHLLFANAGADRCRHWWVASSLSVATSAVVIGSVQAELCRLWRAAGRVRREKGDGRAVTRAVQELRMKGAGFDLGKELQGGGGGAAGTKTKKKSSSVQIWWRRRRWGSGVLVTAVLIGFAGIAVAACRFILCG